MEDLELRPVRQGKARTALGSAEYLFEWHRSLTILYRQTPSSASHLPEQCTPIMATFIAYQSWENAPSLGSHTFSNSPTIGLSSWVSSGQSPKSPQQATLVGNADFVDLTASGQDAARECLVAREILDPTGLDPDKRGIRVAGARSRTTDSDEFENCKECDNDYDIDYESDSSDLPSLADIFPRSDTRFRSDDLSSKASMSPVPVDGTSKESCHRDDSEDSGNPTATAATGVQLGASQGE